MKIKGVGDFNPFCFLCYWGLGSRIRDMEAELIFSMQSLTGSLQGENRVFPVNLTHTGKNLFSLHVIPAMKTGLSL